MLKYAFLLIFVGIIGCRPQMASPFTEASRIKAEESFKGEDLIAAGEDLLRWHITNQTDIPEAINPGLDRSIILESLADLPCQPTEELLQLWEWHNGTQPVLTPFIWYHNFLPVDQALAEYERLTNNPLVGWPPNWIPLFEFEREWYFVECNEEARLASPVGYFFLENGEVFYVYLNLTKMMETAELWFREAAVTWDAEQQGMFEDIRRVFEIHQKINPGTQFPYRVE